jgi:hypothetical protein
MRPVFIHRRQSLSSLLLICASGRKQDRKSAEIASRLLARPEQRPATRDGTERDRQRLPSAISGLSRCLGHRWLKTAGSLCYHQRDKHARNPSFLLKFSQGFSELPQSLSAAKSQERAQVQSRSAVAIELLSIWAISGMVRPAKKRRLIQRSPRLHLTPSPSPFRGCRCCS